MLRLLANVDLLLATILVVNNLVNICIVILTAGIIDSVFTFLRFEFLFKTVLVTFLLLLFGEILPKVLAQTIPLRFASMVARPLLVLRWVFYPLSYALVRTSSRISEKAAHKSEISLDELADAVDMTQSSSPEEHVMLSGIVNFVNTEVQEIMKPRVDITALSLTADYETVKRTIIESGFSRIPVYEEDVDNIRGTLYVKDLLPYINNGGDFAWQQLIRKPYFVPEHKKINDLLADFQSNKVHMAIVVDEYGSTLGLVSLEDIIEEIVGEISDESDNDECFYTRLDAKSYIFEGKTHLGDFERILDIGEDVFADVRGEAETLAGLMLELNLRLARNGLGQQRFTGTGRADEQRSLGDLCADGGVLFGVVQKVDDLDERFFRLVLTGDIRERHAGGFFHVDLGVGLADIADAADPAHAAGLFRDEVHQQHERADHQHRGQNIAHHEREDRRNGRLIGLGVGHAVLIAQGNQIFRRVGNDGGEERIVLIIALAVVIRVGKAVDRRDGEDRVAEFDGLDLPLLHEFDKLAVCDLARRLGGAGLIEHDGEVVHTDRQQQRP